MLVEIGHFEAFPANFGVTDLTLGYSRVAPKGFFLLYYPYPVPKLLAETFLGLGPDLVHLKSGEMTALCKSTTIIIPIIIVKDLFCTDSEDLFCSDRYRH